MLANNNNNCRGLTLIELSFVIILLAMLTTLAAPRFGDITGANLKKSSMRLASLIRYIFDAAIVNNKVYRLNINLKENTYAAEYYEEAAPLSEEEEKDKKEATKEEQEKQDNFVIDPELTAKPLKPDRGVKFKGVFTATNSKLEEEKIAYIQFYPDGSVDDSYLYLSNDRGENVYTLIIQPLTGRTIIKRGFIEYGKD